MSYQKRTLIAIAKKVTMQKPLTPKEITYLIAFDNIHKDSKMTKFFFLAKKYMIFHHISWISFAKTSG